MWKFNTKPYDCIVIFGVEQMMSDLEVKLEKELTNNAVVVACRFPLTNQKFKLQNEIEAGVDSVWVYKKWIVEFHPTVGSEWSNEWKEYEERH